MFFYSKTESFLIQALSSLVAALEESRVDDMHNLQHQCNQDGDSTTLTTAFSVVDKNYISIMEKLVTLINFDLDD